MDQFQRLALYYSESELVKIQSATVCLCGLGGVGGSCLEMLARMGLKKLILVDYDRVDISNLNRQIITTYGNVGELKCDVAKKRVQSYCRQTEVITYPIQLDKDNLNFLDQKIDVVVDAIDMLESKVALIKACQMRKIPIVSSMGMANRSDPSLIKISTLEKTYNDPLAKKMRLLAKRERLKKVDVVFSSELPKKIFHPVSSVSFVVNTAGNFLAGMVIKKILARD